MSRIAAIGLAALILAACQPAPDPEPSTEPAAAATASAPAEAISQSAQDRYRQMEVAPSDPVEALEWRAALCGHLASEFGGDNSERDRELNARMDELRCGDALMADVRALRTARASERDVVARLDAVLASEEP